MIRHILPFLAAVLGAAGPAFAERIELVSTTSAGAAADGTSDAFAINSDGGIIAFRSEADNLVAGDNNGLSDVFAKSFATGRVELLSQSTKGVAGNAFSGGSQSDYRPICISPDGRYVAFQSSASSLAPGGQDSNFFSDIYLRDRTGATTALISLEGASTPGDQQSESPAVSDDGSAVTFQSASGVFNPIDTSGFSDIFLRKPAAFTTTRVSSDRFGGTADGNAQISSISGDGKRIVYQSAGTGLVPSDTNAVDDIFLYDADSALISRVSVTSAGVEGDGASRRPVISNNGRFVAFESDAANFAVDDLNAVTDIFVKDLVTGDLELVSRSTAGAVGTGQSRAPSISADGRFVAFISASDNLSDTPDLNDVEDVFVRDRTAHTTIRVSLRSDGSESSGFPGYAAISGNGQYVAFSSSDNQLVPGDSNGFIDIFRVKINSTLDTDTTIASAPIVEAGRKAVRLTLLKFDQVSVSPAAAGVSRRNIVEYQVSVRQAGRGGDRFQVVSRRNQVTLRNLPPGRYTASYRVAAKRRTTTVRNGSKTVTDRTLFRTNQSPTASFTVRR